MQLQTILLVVVGILTALCGITIFVGARKSERKAAQFFLLAAFFATWWILSIAVFLALKPEHSGIAPLLVFGIYTGAPIMDSCLLAYVGWQHKPVRWLAVFFAVGAAFFAGALLYNPNFLYAGEPSITYAGNAITVSWNWYYIAYFIYLILLNSAILSTLLFRYLKARNKAQRNGSLFFLVGMSITGILALIFNAILPPQRYDLIWVGPLAIGVVLLAYYYSVLRYRSISLSATWLKLLSYVIIICSAAIVYMVIFFIIFSAIFKQNPSTGVFILNFIMITIILLLFPVMSELTSSIRSLIQTNQVDLPYIIRKMNSMTTNVNLNELSDFLADHMHFSYIGIIVEGKLYGSAQLPVTAKELKQITLLKSNGLGRIWQDFNEPVAEVCNREDIKAIAELRDAKGKQFGQLLVGKPMGKMGFERRDLIQIEMIVNLVAAMIDTKAK